MIAKRLQKIYNKTLLIILMNPDNIFFFFILSDALIDFKCI